MGILLQKLSLMASICSVKLWSQTLSHKIQQALIQPSSPHKFKHPISPGADTKMSWSSWAWVNLYGQLNHALGLTLLTPGLVMILDFHLVSVPSGDMVITRGPLFTRMFVTSTPRPVNEAIEYFVDSPGNIRRFPMTRAKAALLPALTRNPFNYVYFHGKDWLQTSSAIFRPQNTEHTYVKK